jgi:hypothetical protein
MPLWSTIEEKSMHMLLSPFPFIEWFLIMSRFQSPSRIFLTIPDMIMCALVPTRFSSFLMCPCFVLLLHEGSCPSSDRVKFPCCFPHCCPAHATVNVSSWLLDSPVRSHYLQWKVNTQWWCWYGEWWWRMVKNILLYISLQAREVTCSCSRSPVTGMC